MSRYLRILPCTPAALQKQVEELTMCTYGEVTVKENTVLVYHTQSSKSQSEEKKIHIKIGFDLTQGENGAPSLRIRDFEKGSPEFHPRASEGKGKNGPSVRADSYSENSGENDEKKPKYSSKEQAGRQGSKSKESSGDESDDEKRGISTRGMDDEYEPPEAARVGKENPTNDRSKESKSSSAEDSASGGDKDDARRHKQGARRHRDADARRHEDAPRRAKRNVPTLKGLMENIRKRSRELFVADRRQAELKAKKS